MAKSDSFFIRASTDFDGTNYAQSNIDLGAYVDALGKSVLRIHNIAVQWGSPIETGGWDTTVNAQACAFQLTTQSQASMVVATDKSVIATGRVVGAGLGGSTNFITEHLDIAPQHFTQGYLVGVEQIYLGVDQSFSSTFDQCTVVLECTVETLSSSAAMALALSQQ